jgi:hypothetical protein
MATQHDREVAAYTLRTLASYLKSLKPGDDDDEIPGGMLDYNIQSMRYMHMLDKFDVQRPDNLYHLANMIEYDTQ